METIESIIEAAGGLTPVSERTGLTQNAVKKWLGKGIPDWHWKTVMQLSGADLDQMFAANAKLREARKETAA
mgnify:CR=1 FL=1